MINEKSFCKITGKECGYWHYFRCTLLDAADPLEPEVCLKDELLPDGLAKDGLQMFMAGRHPMDVLSWISYERRDKVPKPGDCVFTLTGGFSTTRPGKILKVSEVTDTMVSLENDGCSASGRGYGVERDGWWRKLFVLPDRNGTAV